MDTVVWIDCAWKRPPILSQLVSPCEQGWVSLLHEQGAVLHTKWRQNVALYVIVERFAGHIRDHGSENLEGHVAVFGSLARREIELEIAEASHIAVQRTLVVLRLTPFIIVDVRHP